MTTTTPLNNLDGDDEGDNERDDDDDDDDIIQIWSFEADNRLILHCDTGGVKPNAFFPMADKQLLCFQGGNSLYACPLNNGTTTTTNTGSSSSSTSSIRPELLCPLANSSCAGDVLNVVHFQEKLYFSAHIGDEPEFGLSSRALFASDGTAEGTVQIFYGDDDDGGIGAIQTHSPGQKDESVGNLKRLVEGIPKMVFSGSRDGFWTTDGTTEGTKRFLDDNLEWLGDISEPFNGGKFLFRTSRQLPGFDYEEKLWVTSNWENETSSVLLDNFELGDAAKLNNTHVIFVQRQPADLSDFTNVLNDFSDFNWSSLSAKQSTTTANNATTEKDKDDQGVIDLWITDGTINGTHKFFTTEGLEFRIGLKVADRYLEVTRIVGGYGFDEERQEIPYVTDGTTEGTKRLVHEEPRIKFQVQAQTFLSDGRAVVMQ